ncbi:hypothetical protein [Micromonospora sp. HM5-17]|uniref:hypothetical protein n=1 Tax=Micromonospora sp. HM5-17 TaxID=2487710 RepID=UPI000F4AA8AB|nr:hypothetical protein [Micromonospora sp. HM5-17]ROT31909.1 hypothetical protein EF879_09665 [Micromonospora sp. HM5-17]
MTTTMYPTAWRTRIAMTASGALFLSLATAGCGGSDDSPQGSPPSAVPGTSLGATPETGPATGLPGTGLPEAADGTNVRACYDGSCEILVTRRVTIPLDPRFGFTTFSFDPADSTWRYTDPEGGSGSLKLLEPPYSGELTGPSATQSLAVRVVATEGSTAVIALRPAD